MSKTRVVLAGCGGICGAWLGSQAVKEHCEVVGLVDLRREAAEGVKAKHGLAGAETSTELEPLLRKLKPEIVFDCTIPAAHERVSTTALACGCHVISEKPMSDTFAAARRMVAAADAAGRTLAVTQTRRFLPGIRRLRRFLESGAIGRIHSVHADFFIAADFGGFRATMDHVLLVDMAIHSFDQARLIAGNPRMLSAISHEWNPPGSWYRHGASAMAGFAMEGDLAITYRGSWTATGVQTSWECAWRVLGDRGAVTWDGGDGFQAEGLADPAQPSAEKGGGLIKTLRRIEVPPIEAGMRTGHDGVLLAVLDDLAAGRVPETDCHDNLHSVAMVCAAVKSAETGRRIAFDEL